MLPKIKSLSDDFGQLLTRYMRLKINEQMVMTNEVRKTVIHEGENTAFIREDGTLDVTDMTESSTEFSLSYEEIVKGDLESILNKIEKAAADMADSMSRTFLNTLEQVTEKTGNVVRGADLPPEESLLQMMEKIHLAFDENGRPRLPSILAGKEAAERFRQADEKLRSSPELMNRWRTIMHRKYLEWKDEEASRKLVG